MGCSNPHPHGQVWAGDTIPEDVCEEMRSFATWEREKGGKCLLCEYLKLEIEKGTRVVCENESFVVVVPYWAYWPFEVLVMPKRHVGRLVELSEVERDDLASILKRITVRYDNVFETSFPYSMGVHQVPVNAGEKAGPYHLHLHFYPPLLRSASVKFVHFYVLLRLLQFFIS